MKIILKKLKLTNFKGISQLEVNFNEIETSVFGDNKTGKTTLMDSYLWLNFNKDSTYRTDFEIKTLGPDNQYFHRLNHEVEAIINVDGQDICLRRVYKEKWVKQRGATQPSFTGHETTCFWNNVPMKQEEYQAKINSLLNENLFKLITSTGYFNSLPWQERRNVLLQIAGEIDNFEILNDLVAKNGISYTLLLDALNAKKTVEEFKREIAVKKKKIKDELMLIPSRIDEADRSMPELLNYDELGNTLTSLQLDLTNIETQLLNKTAAQKKKQETISAKIREIQNLRQQTNEIEFAEKNKVLDSKRTREQVVIDLRRDVRNKLDEATRNAIEIANNSSRKKSIESHQQELRIKWAAINNEKLEFKENEFSCPTCKREYEASDIEAKKKELVQNFNQHKSTRLNQNSVDGKKLTESIVAINNAIAAIKTKDELIQAEITELKQTILKHEQDNADITTNESLQVEQNILSNKVHKVLSEKITLLEEEVNSLHITDDKQPLLLEQKKEISAKIDAVKGQLSTREQREKTEKRIAELKDQEKSIAQELATLEGVEYSIEQFTKAKMDTLERRINGRFKIVTFKLFSEQINGGQVECCDTLVRGVPYSDINNAARIQSGLDIITTLSDHYNVYAPVFLDNRESVIEIPKTNSQIINLIVSANDKKLRVDSEQPVLAEVA